MAERGMAVQSSERVAAGAGRQKSRTGINRDGSATARHERQRGHATAPCNKTTGLGLWTCVHLAIQGTSYYFILNEHILHIVIDHLLYGAVWGRSVVGTDS